MRHSNSKNDLTRRELLRLAAAGVTMGSASGWLNTVASSAAENPVRNGSVILLWMGGGPSQTDTFDMKPDHANGGEFKPIATSVPGMQISEHLPTLAEQMHHCVPIRSMKTKEGDHSRGTYYMRTGYAPMGPVHYPTMGSIVSNELGRDDSKLPNFVSISPFTGFNRAAFGPGFLGPRYAPLVVGSSNAYVAGIGDYEAALRVKNLKPNGVAIEQADKRLELLAGMDQDFRQRHAGITVGSHDSAYEQAKRMMRSRAANAFDLSSEDEKLRDAYGRNQFGQGCLLARRLVERGVPFVEVSLNAIRNAGRGSNALVSNQVYNWDSHQANFSSVKGLSQVLDPGWGTLLNDLHLRGLLDSTLVVWMGEFSRTPIVNRSGGRDHYPNAWTTVLCGGGIKGGQFYGKTSAGGTTVEENPVNGSDLIATVCSAIGLDPMKQNMSNVGRPIRLADPDAKPISEILA